jgi:hypothetical protein
MESICLKRLIEYGKGDKIVLFSKDSQQLCFYEILNGNRKLIQEILVGE